MASCHGRNEFLPSLNKNLHATSRKCTVSLELSTHTSSCSLNGPICLNPSLTNLVKIFLLDPRNGSGFQNYENHLGCRYPNGIPQPQLTFHIYTDASNYQMGAVIVQQKCPVAYWSRKLTETQQNYHTVEKELLSITMVLEEFCSMLLGTELFIYTDHKNLTFTTINFLRLMLALVCGRVWTYHPLSPWQEKCHC